MTPESHRDQAIQLLADVNETEAPSEARVLTQAAIAHALLGLLGIEMAKARVQGLDITGMSVRVFDSQYREIPGPHDNLILEQQQREGN